MKNKSNNKEITIRIAIKEPAYNLDPRNEQTYLAHYFNKHIFSSLVKTDYENNIIPDLAYKWEISNNGLEYKFHLRDDVYFHNGEKLTGQGYLDCINNNFIESYKSQDLSVLNVVDGYENSIKHKKTISGIKLINHNILVFKLKYSFPDFLYTLDGRLFPYPISETPNKNFSILPIGSGPYKIVENQNDQIVLIKNNKYYGELPYADKLVFKYYPQDNMAVDDFNNNNLDILFFTGSHLENKLKNFYKLDVFSQRFYYIILNNTKPPFNNKKLRQAFNYLIDKNSFTQFQSGVEVSHQIFGYDIFGRLDNEEAKNIFNSFKSDKYKNELKSYNFIIYNLFDKWKNFIEKNLEKNEFKFTSHVVENIDDLIKNIIVPKAFDIIVMGYGVGYPTMDAFSRLFLTDGLLNDAGYSNKHVNHLFEQGRQEQNIQKRRNIYKEIARIITEESPVVPLGFASHEIYFKNNIIIKKQRVFNETFDFTDNNIEIK